MITPRALGQGNAFHGEVICFCGTSGKEDFLGRAVNEIRTLFAGGFDGLSSSKTMAVE